MTIFGLGFSPLGIRWKISKIVNLLIEVPVEFYIIMPEELDRLRLPITAGLEVNF